MPNLKFKVRVVNRIKTELAQRWFNYDIATSKAAKDSGWVIEDPELNEKLKANGLEAIDAIKQELKPEEKSEKEVKEQVEEKPEVKEEEKTTTDQVKDELKKEEVDYDKLSFPDLRTAAKEKGINTFGKKKVDIIAELKN